MDGLDIEDDAISGAQAMALARSAHDLRRHLVITDLCRHARRDVRATLQGCDALMAVLRDKLPEPVFMGASPYFTGQRAECDHWAEFASDGQVAAMLGACLDRIADTRLVVDDRKRLLVAVWNSLTPDDRRAFRDRVMPKDPSLR
ncbi:MAG: hypothetical protein ACK4MS_10595 [Paracoccaceae bacterium]